MQPDENKDNNMNTLNAPAENGVPNGLSAADGSANNGQQETASQPIANQSGVNQPMDVQSTVNQPVAEQPFAPQSITPKKSKIGLIICSIILLILLVIGVSAAIVMMNTNTPNTSGDEQIDTSSEEDVDEEEEEIEVGEPKVDIDQTGSAEVENGVFSIKDQNGAVLVEDEEMPNITGVKTCETLENDIQSSVRCIVSTEDGEGVYVYYPEENVLKFAEE